MKLTLVGLPLGNIEDIGVRAVKILSSASLVICEDTRVFYKLWQKLMNLEMLSHKFDGQLMVINEFNEKFVMDKTVEAILASESAVMVSDAGMPIVSDPGFRVVREVIKRGGEITTVPGPTAAMSALAISGLSSDRVFSMGFLPKKNAKRVRVYQMIKNIGDEGVTVIMYESAKRVWATLQEIEEFFGRNLDVVIAREITKEHEQVIRGKIGEIIEQNTGKSLKGEIVVLMRIEN